MRVLKLRKQEEQFFSWLDPYDYLDRLVFPNYFALAAVAEDEEGMEMPAGLIVACDHHDSIEINWISASPAFVGKGVGDELLNSLFLIADKAGRKYLKVRFTYEDELTDVLGNVEDFFKDSLFLEEEELNGEWFISIASFLKSDMFKNEKKLPAGMHLLDEMTTAEANHLVTDVLNLNKAYTFYNLLENTFEFDPGISSALIKDGRVQGLMLNKLAGETCFPILLYGETGRETHDLLAKAAEGMKKSRMTGYDIRINGDEENLCVIFNRYFKKSRIRSKMLIANIDDYRQI